MKKVVAAGFLVVLAVELIAFAAPDRRLILVVSGAAVTITLLTVRWYLLRDGDFDFLEPPIDDAEQSLRRWLSRTETLISRSETTRTDWDRHLRPMLARQFEMATGQKRNKDQTSYHATGRMLFGTELWEWVNPENVSRSGATQPGPGRAALDEILRRLERV